MGNRRRRRSQRRTKRSKGSFWADLGASPLKVLVPVALVLFGGFYYVYSSFQTLGASEIENPLSEGSSNRLLVDREGVESTLVVLEAPLDDKILSAWLLVNNERSGATIVYYIPGGVYMDDYSGVLDTYVSIADLRYAGEILDKERSFEYAIWQINNLTGISIDSYIWLDSTAVDQYSSLFGDLSEFQALDYSIKYSGAKDSPNSAFILDSFLERLSLVGLLTNQDSLGPIISGTYSNLSAVELLPRLLDLKGVLGGDEIIMFDLSQPWASKETTTASDRQINVVDYPSVDEEFSQYTGIMRGREIEREQVKIEVYNASGIPEIAYRYARKLENSGMNVVRYENAPEQIDKTQVYVTRPEEFSASLELTKKLLVVGVNEVNIRPSFITTGDIVILLGKDMNQEVNWN